MTNEEAIAYGKRVIDLGLNDETQAFCELAIKVLETISKYKDAYNKGWDDGAKATYEHLKMCEEEQSGDLISRQAVLDIIHLFFTEEVDKIPTKKTEDGEVLIMCKAQPLFAMNKTLCKRIKALQSASPTQNCVGNALDMRCDDAISRQKVLDVINLNWEYRRNCIRAIEKLPPVKQEPSSSENDLLQRLRKRISDLYNTDVTYDNGDYNTMDTPTLDKVLEYFDSEVNT